VTVPPDEPRDATGVPPATDGDTASAEAAEAARFAEASESTEAAEAAASPVARDLDRTPAQTNREVPPVDEAPPAPSPHRAVGEPVSDDPRITGEMPFLRHLDELRKVLMHVVIATAAGAIGGWLLSPLVLEDLIRRTVTVAVILNPIEAINERIKLSLLLGLMLAGPFVFYRIWQFVVPGLFKRERSLILPMAMSSMVLFAAGVAAAYGYIVPLVIHVLANFMTPGMHAQIRLADLLSFFYNVALACGVICQLPLVTMTLTAIGLVTPGFLIKQWRYAIVGAFVVTAAITPGDVITAQLILGGPMVLLYFLSVGLSWLVARRRKPEQEVTSAGIGSQS
jgi:sec-independent protein translocase protein TatC